MKKSFVVLLLSAMFLFAVFSLSCGEEPTDATLTLKIAGTGTGTVSYGNNEFTKDQNIKFAKNAVVMLTATPDGTDVFAGWSGDIEDNTDVIEITMTSDKTLTATFNTQGSGNTYTLTINTSGTGTGTVNVNSSIYSSPMEINENSSVTLTASPEAGSTFTGWSGDVNNTNTETTFTMDGNKTITAEFGLQTEQGTGTQLTLNQWEEGDLNNNTEEWFWLYTTPGTKYRIDNHDSFYSNPENPGTADFDCALGAYKKNQSTNYTYITPSGETGQIDLGYDTNPDYIDFEATENIVQIKGTHYDGAGSGAGAYFLKVSEIVETYSVDVTVVGNGSVEKRVGGSIDNGPYPAGTQVELTAVPNGTDTFEGWSDDVTGSDNPKTIIVNSDMNITATFTGTAPQKDWLVLMYMDGDCNLEAALWGDVNEMEKGLYDLNSTVRENVTFVVLWDGSTDDDAGYGYTNLSPAGSKLYELTPESTENTTLVSTELTGWTGMGSEVNMGDGDTITNFLDWADTNYPNYTNRMLILSNHGGGARSRGTTPNSRAICWDDSVNPPYGDTLYSNELSAAIEASTIDLNIIGMDACLMAAAEEAYQLRNSADYFIASLESEQGDGWEFNHWIPQMTNNMTPSALGTVIVQSYEYNFDSSYGDQTLSCTDLSQMDNLKTAIDNLTAQILVSSDITNIKTVFEGSQHFAASYTSQYELGEFCENLVSEGYLTTEANAVLSVMESAIVYSWADYASGDYYGAGTTTKKGLSLAGQEIEIDYSTGEISAYLGTYPDWYHAGNLDFATTGDGWKEVLLTWYD